MAGGKFENAETRDDVCAVLDDQQTAFDCGRKVAGRPQATVTEMRVDARKFGRWPRNILLICVQGRISRVGGATGGIILRFGNRGGRRGARRTLEHHAPASASACYLLAVGHSQGPPYPHRRTRAGKVERAQARRRGASRGVHGAPVRRVFRRFAPTMSAQIPIFALLLKLFDVFRRRLYTEHLIVALHSHAFLFLNLLPYRLVTMLAARVKPHVARLAHPLNWIDATLWPCAPVCLLIMQKRIYRQGWPLTIVKSLAVGWS